MAISRAFAYNTGAAIVGLAQVGNLAISGTSFSGLTSSLSWYNGPDESLGYVIAYESPGNTVPNSATFARVQFWRTSTQSDATFISLVQYISNRHGSPQNFTTGSSASSWLSSNGYWTNWETLVFQAGLYKTTYKGYFADDVNFFATAAIVDMPGIGGNPATSVQTTVISEPSQNDGENFSCQWLGYFRPGTTETYTFYTSSDDASYVWVGNVAKIGFTTGNALVNNGGAHGVQEASGSIALTAGSYYPIRIQFGEQGGGDVMTFNYSTPTITKTTNVDRLVFYNPITNNF